ncbi:hypothetical protein Tco_0352788 [Tanacetum coccineum]
MGILYKSMDAQNKLDSNNLVLVLKQESMEYMMKKLFGLRWNSREVKGIVKLRVFRLVTMILQWLEDCWRISNPKRRQTRTAWSRSRKRGFYREDAVSQAVTRKTLKGRKQLGEYQTGWKIKTGNVLDFCNLRSTQQCMKSGVAKHLGVAVIQQKNGLVKETNMTLLAKESEEGKLRLSNVKNEQPTPFPWHGKGIYMPNRASLWAFSIGFPWALPKLAYLGPVTTEEKVQRKNDVKARSRLQKINTHVVFWRNKPDLDAMSFDDLYNNFKIVEQEVKRIASSSSSSQNMAFMSSPSSTNEVNTAYRVSTANTQVSLASTQVSIASTQVSNANLSDDTVYAFLASQPNGSQLVYEDLEQTHEDDIEEMDLKWQLALLSMRTRRFFLKTGRNITINGSDTAGYDKNKNQDISRRTVNVEETSSKAMVTIDEAGFDWSYMADDEVPTNVAFMALSDSEFNKSEFNLATYKRGLASVEEQLVFYKKNEATKFDLLSIVLLTYKIGPAKSLYLIRSKIVFKRFSTLESERLVRSVD